MAIINCDTCRYSSVPTKEEPCWSCAIIGGIKFNWEAMTNADRIRSMTDEELAKMLPTKSMWNCPPDIKTRGGCPGECVPCWLNWLKQEEEE